MTPFKQEVAFTTIHELGHVFNLLHVSNPINLMSRRGEDLHPPPYGFVEKHRLMLKRCSTSKYIHPGGSDFGDRGPFGVEPSPDPRNAPAEFGLALTLEFALSEFWCFEPVEVDVIVAVRRGVDRAFTIPNAMDPGYSTFAIWIEEPDGERRRYRSAKQFCGTADTVLIAPEAPFRRDISIFGQSGGFTFTKAGVHHIWAVMELNDGAIASAPVPVNVLPVEDSRKYEEYAQAFVPPGQAQFMYYRRGAPKIIERMAAFAEQRKGEIAAAETEYAIGRALVTRAARRLQSLRKSDTERAKALSTFARQEPFPARRDDGPVPAEASEHFKRAYDHHLLSRHRRELIEECLAKG